MVRKIELRCVCSNFDWRGCFVVSGLNARMHCANGLYVGQRGVYLSKDQELFFCSLLLHVIMLREVGKSCCGMIIYLPARHSSYY